MWRRNDRQDRRRHGERRIRPLTCSFGAPGRTRTCNLRIRSETRPVRLMLPWSIAAGRVRSAVRMVASRPALSHRPDCQRDCQPHDSPRPNQTEPMDSTSAGLHPLGGAMPRARSTADNSSSFVTDPGRRPVTLAPRSATLGGGSGFLHGGGVTRLDRRAVGMLAGTVVLVAVTLPLAAGRDEAFETVLYATLPLVLGVVGTLIASRHPGNPIGWLFCWSFVVDLMAWVVVVLLFPDGRLPGRRWRRVIWVSLAGAGLLFVGQALNADKTEDFSGGRNPLGVDSPLVDAAWPAGAALLV